MSERARVRFLKDERVLEVPVGSNLMRSLQDADIPVASSCDGEGICGKCRLQVHEGAAHLSPQTELEEFLRERYQLKPNERISCQCEVRGDIRIHATYW